MVVDFIIDVVFLLAGTIGSINADTFEQVVWDTYRPLVRDVTPLLSAETCMLWCESIEQCSGYAYSFKGTCAVVGEDSKRKFVCPGNATIFNRTRTTDYPDISTEASSSISSETSSSTSTHTSTTTTRLPEFGSVGGSNVTCFQEWRSFGRVSTNGLCCKIESDICSSSGLASIHGHCVGLQALEIVSDTVCLSLVRYTFGDCVPWEALSCERQLPTQPGLFRSDVSCSSGIRGVDGCSFSSVSILSPRYHDQILGFLNNADETGVLLSGCYFPTTALNPTFCTVSPDSGITQGCQDTLWTKTGSKCLPEKILLNFADEPCGPHSVIVSGSGGSTCVGWDKGAVTAPFGSQYTATATWFTYDGKDVYDKPSGPLVPFDVYMRWPRVLISPIN